MFASSNRVRLRIAAFILGVACATGSAHAQDQALDRRLLRAAQDDSAEKVAEFLKQGADPNAADDTRRSALCEAVGNLNPKVVQVLLDAGAKPDSSAMWQAGWLNKVDAAKQMLAAGGSPDPCLRGAAQGGHAGLVRLLLDRGAKPNSQAGDDDTALHGAALQGGLETVRMLLAAGADSNATDDQGESPLHKAVSGDAELARVKALVDAGAKLDITNNEGLTPLRLAATRSEKRIYEYLLKVNGGKEPLPRSDLKSTARDKSTTELIKALQSRSRETQSEAQRELAARGKKIMPEVIKSLDSGAPVEHFLPLFEAMGEEAEAALPKLAELLGDKKYVLAIAMTLERMKPGGLRELPLPARKTAAATLYAAATDAEAGEMAPWHLDMLKNLDDLAPPYLLKMLQSGDARQQIAAADSLQRAKFASPEIRAELMKLTRVGNDQRVRVEATKALGSLGGANAEAKELLLKVMRDPPPFEERRDDGRLTPYDAWQQRAEAAARSLARFGPEVIDDLVPLLSPIDAPYRGPAMTALQSIGPPAIPRLIELLGHEDKAVAVSASVALNRIGSRSVPELTKALGSDNDQVIVGAASALWWIGGGAKQALPALLGVTESEKRSDAARSAAARAALKIDPNSRSFKAVHSAIAALIRVLEKKGDYHEQAAAAETLGELGAAAREALPALRRQVESPNADPDVADFIRFESKKAIEAIEKSAQEPKK